MVAGVTGHLISSGLLAERVRAQTREERMRRRLIDWKARCASLGPAVSLRAMMEIAVEPFIRILGFSGLADIHYDEHVASGVLIGPQPIALLATPWGDPLEPMWRPAVVASRQLGAEWCVLFNGQSLRLVDARRLYSRRFVELDLDIAVDDLEAAGAVMMLFGAEAFAATQGPAPITALVAESERHGAAVCRGLRDGVLHASEAVFGALTRGRRTNRVDSFDQALTIVYRLLFLLFAEARSLVPMWHPLYRDNYSVASLRQSAEQRSGALGLWDALRAVSRIAHNGCVAGELRVTAFNGRLFAPARTPLAERRNLDNQAVGRAVLALATRPAADGAGREPIAYRDLGVEQLGAVYETLLDYVPSTESPAQPEPACPPNGERRRDRLPSPTLRRGSGLRKATGTFYTPQPLAHYVVRRTLSPLVQDASPERILDLKVVDPAMGSGAFLVAACEYLAAAYEFALVQSGSCHPTDLGFSDRAAIRRSVAERCLYGVDSNPMAVQLARLSLWLTTLAADRPLTFLDHHLQVGDSLVGAWLANLRRPPARQRTRRGETLPLFDTAMLGEALRDAVPARFALASPADTVDDVRNKERLLTALNRRDASLTRWKRLADLWCAAWFDPEGAPASAFAAFAVGEPLRA